MRFTALIIIRVVLIVGNIFLIGWILGDGQLFFNQIILSLILIAQIVELIYFVNHTNRELARLFFAVKHGDFSITFKQRPLGRSFKDLQQSMSEIIDAYKRVKIEREAQFQFLQVLITQLRVGIISIADDEIVLINPTAEQLLNIKGLKNWSHILQLNPEFANRIGELGENGRRLIEIKNKEETRVFSVDISTHLILEREHKLITFQDINSEIEQKEIEAWHKLIRILTHEIMNSITPIASLTETMQGMLSDKDGNQRTISAMTNESISDIRFSLNTIQNRSEGLLQFVENYRRLAKLPKPKPEVTNINTFLYGIEKLMTESLQRQQIKISLEVSDTALSANFDPTLMEQVIINLITNSANALEGRPNKRIAVKAHLEDGQVVIEVSDNGNGIPEKDLKEIFIPFFSTRREGSGIGLSLSKQIISQHGGRIKVKSIPDQGTSFSVFLRNAVK
jgi:two-component system, NtrC family, nitrogen regulation sensor histidine kinase NtrY